MSQISTPLSGSSTSLKCAIVISEALSMYDRIRPDEA
jgi:hypothetical protein